MMPPLTPPYRPHGTAEFLFDDFDDVPDNIQTLTVEAVLKPPRTEPAELDWLTASWDPTKPATVAYHYDGTLPAGWYKLWVRVNNTIVRECGPVRLT